MCVTVRPVLVDAVIKAYIRDLFEGTISILAWINSRKPEYSDVVLLYYYYSMSFFFSSCSVFFLLRPSFKNCL